MKNHYKENRDMLLQNQINSVHFVGRVSEIKPITHRMNGDRVIQFSLNMFVNVYRSLTYELRTIEVAFLARENEHIEIVNKLSKKDWVEIHGFLTTHRSSRGTNAEIIVESIKVREDLVTSKDKDKRSNSYYYQGSCSIGEVTDDDEE